MNNILTILAFALIAVAMLLNTMAIRGNSELLSLIVEGSALQNQLNEAFVDKIKQCGGVNDQ